MMKKNLKKAMSLVLASVVVFSLTACSNGSGTIMAMQADGKETGSGTEDMTIEFCWWGGNSRHETTEKAVDTFMAKHPNVKVECGYGAWVGWEEKQSLAIQGDNATDVMQINWNWIASYGGNRTNFVSLEDYGDVPDLTQFSQDNLGQCKADGKLMAVSATLTGRLFHWNKTTFDEVECGIPTDEVSLLEARVKFKVYDGDCYLLTMVEYDRTIFLVCYLESVYGKPWVEGDGLRYTARETQTGMGLMTKLRETHVIPIVAMLRGGMVDSLGENTKVVDGKYAGVFEWDSVVSKIQKAIAGSTAKLDQKPAIGDFLKFGDYDNGFTKISMALAVPANLTHPKGAVMLVSYLLDDDEAIKVCGTECGVPYSAEDVKILEEKGISDKLVMETNARILAYSKFPLDPIFEHSDLKTNPSSIYYKVFGKLSAGDIASTEAAEDLTKDIDGHYNF